jgi:hypothetical protein
MLGQYFKIGLDHFLPLPFQFTIHCYSLIQCYIINAVEKSLLNKKKRSKDEDDTFLQTLVTTYKTT